MTTGAWIDIETRRVMRAFFGRGGTLPVLLLAGDMAALPRLLSLDLCTPGLTLGGGGGGGSFVAKVLSGSTGDGLVIEPLNLKVEILAVAGGGAGLQARPRDSTSQHCTGGMSEGSRVGAR